jgi:hypothetical protein
MWQIIRQQWCCTPKVDQASTAGECELLTPNLPQLQNVEFFNRLMQELKQLISAVRSFLPGL